jgi:hypothetical protein
MSDLPPAGPVPPARVENNDILCVFPTNETRHNDNGLTTSVRNIPEGHIPVPVPYRDYLIFVGLDGG